ncbi:hypothetical protein JCM15548_12677 [Geofilum rubicundum JCM 15548]|uniref:Uncharacterized protein n=1 Tax=Geofilum rubicundum JCM 15548 TaxID=1236989 RepID=A0A0E9LYU7_9BACT|nr:hypothetical protein JCM15548_12677 [Geofilum rubicundum JCM 15548]
MIDNSDLWKGYPFYGHDGGSLEVDPEPISTLGSPATILPPCAVMLPIVATGTPLISTVGSPCTMVSGGPAHTQTSPIRAAGFPLISTLGAPGPATGPPT